MATTTLSSSPTAPIEPSGRRLGAYAVTAGRDATYLLVGLPAGVVTFTVLVTGLSLAGGLAITLLGIPVLLATLYAARGMGDAERWRASQAGMPVSRTRRPWTGGPIARTKAAATDLGAWRDALWGLLMLPIGIAGFTIAVTAWSTALGLLTSPAWYWSLPDNDDQPNATLEFLNAHSLGANVARAAAGLVLVPVAYYVCRVTAAATLHAARAILQH
ncbi:MAG TPA: sensor domain-containing protein [Baekduia sp.]|uniref:sensor domain-containing protein n=1 Tax=Baekduia sp. TaxID=2600305 RepID=UPI002D77FD1C|nr:sensor domain-containing protein [Baekduia sp.]HET6509604.1 sensor domain-containing protein [Baekduia sp.]